MTTETPSPQPPSPPQPSAQQQPPSRTAPRVIAILTAALGSLVVVGTLASSAIPTFAASSASVGHGESRDLAVDGVTALDVDVEAMSLSIVFDDVDEATLEVADSDRGSWVFEREGASLRVETPESAFASWFGNGNGRATLTLPEALAGLDAGLQVGGGSLDANGDFGALELDLGAGSIEVRGTAETLVAEVSAGTGDIDLADVSTADLSLGAGELLATLSGEAPDEVIASVSAGTLDVTLPDEVYDVSTDVAAGDVQNDLRVSSDSPRTVQVEVSAGNARLLTD